MGASVVIDTLNGLSYLTAISPKNIANNNTFGPVDLLDYLGVITFPIAVGAGGQGTLNMNVIGSADTNVLNAVNVTQVQAFTAFNNANAGGSSLAFDTRVAPRYVWFVPNIVGSSANYTISSVGTGQKKVQ